MPIIFSKPLQENTNILPTNTLPDFSHPLEVERLTALRQNRVLNLLLNLIGNLYAVSTVLAQIPDRYFPVTPKTFPTLYELYEDARTKLEIQKEYSLFCTMNYTRNARTVGTDDNCVIVIDSSCLEDFSDKQISALLGRELGHIKKRHVSYLNAFDMIDDLLISIPFGSRLLGTTMVNGAKGLFLEWLLVAEYTADRAAAIVAGDIKPVMQNHLMTSGIENVADCQNYKLYTQAPLERNLNHLGRAAQVVLTGTIKMFPIPFVIPRMQELEKWSTSEECRENFPQVYSNSFISTEIQTSPKTISKSLIKGQKIELAKKDSNLREILIGLGWDTSEYNSSTNFDLDAEAFLLKANGKVNDDNDFIFYGNLKHTSGSVEHFGDNLNGEGECDDEQIKVDLSKVPDYVDKIDFTVTIYEAEERKQTFGQVKNAFIRVVNAETSAEIIRYDLCEDFSVETAIVVGEIYCYKGDWKFHAIGAGFKGGLKALCENYGVEVS